MESEADVRPPLLRDIDIDIYESVMDELSRWRSAHPSYRDGQLLILMCCNREIAIERADEALSMRVGPSVPISPERRKHLMERRQKLRDEKLICI